METSNWLLILIVFIVSTACKKDENEEISLNDINKFSFEQVDSVVSKNIYPEKALIKITVPYSTELTSLNPKIKISPDASISPSETEIQDFSKPVTYTVTAEDGTQKHWTVIVTHNYTNENLDLSKAGDNYKAFLKVRGSLDTSETIVFWWTGNIYADLPDSAAQLILQFEGLNVGKLEKIPTGYRLLTRECAFYKDPVTGEIKETWKNPFNKETVEIVHVWNDPVNQVLPEENWFGVPYQHKGESVAMYTDINLKYPNPLQPSEYPGYSTGTDYIASELFNFFADMKDLNNKALKTVPAQITWTRVSQWLPWMHMGTKPGNLIYQCRGKKLLGGFEAIPKATKEYINKNKPEFASSPESYETPNITSWSYFKYLVDNNLYDTTSTKQMVTNKIIKQQTGEYLYPTKVFEKYIASQRKYNPI